MTLLFFLQNERLRNENVKILVELYLNNSLCVLKIINIKFNVFIGLAYMTQKYSYLTSLVDK